MKRLLYILIAVVAFGCTTRTQQPVVLDGLAMHSSILQEDIKYSVVLPTDYYTSGKSYPVAYLLHGLGDNESSWLEYGRIDYYAHSMTKSGYIKPMIYVMPQGFRTYYVNDYKGAYRYQDMFIQELIPHIDSAYRTIADKEHRATMGYSMGGFGALILPLKHPDVISVSVPLSISIRTDEQYMNEESPWWDEQWGRLFGGENEKGAKRITDYYRANNPFYIFSKKENVPTVKIYIDNGDDEETLSYSNEKLHLLMQQNSIPHEFRVRDGGHSFLYWCSALQSALPFISDAFEGKPYRGDKQEAYPSSKISSVQWKIFNNNERVLPVFVPECYNSSTRQYPTLYLLAQLSKKEQEQVASGINARINSGELPPFIVLFCHDTTTLGNIIPEFEKQFRARSGYRFRSAAGYGDGGKRALYAARQPQTFASAISVNASLDSSDVAALLTNVEADKKPFNRVWLYVDAAENCAHASGNSHLHLALKSAEVKHEYRVRENKNIDFEYFTQSISQALPFIGNSFHR